jgi:phage-related protein
MGPGVFELRDQDESAWYRVIYLSRVRGVIHVLHCFEKQSRETPMKEINTARQRLKVVRGTNDSGEKVWSAVSQLT